MFFLKIYLVALVKHKSILIELSKYHYKAFFSLWFSLLILDTPFCQLRSLRRMRKDVDALH